MVLHSELDDIKDDVISGLYTGETADKTAQLYSKAIGRAEQLQDVIYILETFGEDDEEEKEEND